MKFPALHPRGPQAEPRVAEAAQGALLGWPLSVQRGEEPHARAVGLSARPCRGALRLRHDRSRGLQHPGEPEGVRAPVPPAQRGGAHAAHADLRLSR